MNTPRLKRIFGACRRVLACLACLMAATGLASAGQPNIIVVLVDDMGFSDIGCYGSEIPTPNLDALADGGLRFTQFYNTGRCCPTRASLLTGLYSHQAGIGHMTNDDQVPGYRGRLNDECVTIAEVLNTAGYLTAMTGKWHVGQNHGVTPWGRGFARSLNAAAGGFYFPGSPKANLFLNGVEIPNDDSRLPKGWYSTDLWTSQGLKFIDEAVDAKKPFFLYLAHNAPHFPLQAPEEAIAKFRGKYMAGWSEISAARYAKQKQLGLIQDEWTKTDLPAAVTSWDQVSDDEKERFDHLMATYAAVVYRMDQAMGDLVSGLKQRGVFDNTLILFMSDNGGNAESGPNGRTQGDPSKFDSNWFCGESWAYAENTPFRMYKHYNHEGGIATPLVAHWTNGIFAKGELRTQPAHLIDIMATCVDVSGATYPSEFNSHSITPMQGKSLVSAFKNETIEREALYWEHEGNAAIRVGDWKLVRRGRVGQWELYNMSDDRTEQRDLAGEQPEKVKQLSEKWDAWAVKARVKPYPQQAQKPKQGKKSGKRQRQTAKSAPSSD